MDAEESKRWFDARRWPEDHPQRVASRQEWEEMQALQRLGPEARRRIERALWTGHRLDSADERALLVRRAERTLATRFGGMPQSLQTLLWWPLAAVSLGLPLLLHHLPLSTRVEVGAAVYGATAAAAVGMTVAGRRRVRRAIEVNLLHGGERAATRRSSA